MLNLKSEWLKKMLMDQELDIIVKINVEKSLKEKEKELDKLKPEDRNSCLI